MNETQNDTNVDVDRDTYARRVLPRLHRARVTQAFEERVRKLRIVNLDFKIIGGSSSFSPHARFVFREDWRPAEDPYAGRQLGEFMKQSLRFPYSRPGLPSRTLAVPGLVGATGLVEVGERSGKRKEVIDFWKVRIDPETDLEIQRDRSGLKVDAAVLHIIKPCVGFCPVCLRKADTGEPKCPDCGFKQRLFWAEHCQKCLAQVSDSDLHCSACGATLIDYADAVTAAKRS